MSKRMVRKQEGVDLSDSDYRPLEVPEAGAGMRLDRFLARYFPERTRSELAPYLRAGLVRDADGRTLRASSTVRAKQRLRLYLPGIAPSMKKPPLPPILHEDDRVVVLDKPAGLPVHPAGTDYTFAVIGLARDHWPKHGIELVHRLDKDTSGVLVLAKDADANRQLKGAFARGQATKDYFALVRGHPPWESAVFDGRIGPANGPIRIQMAVTHDGQDAHTEAFVLARHAEAAMSQVRCRIRTGRTHQIRVHLAHAGYGLVGDRMYGVPPEVFLRGWEHGVDTEVIRAAGAPRQALHAHRVTIPHPNGSSLTVEAPIPPDLLRWWSTPSVLPFDAEPAAEPAPDETRTAV